MRTLEVNLGDRSYPIHIGPESRQMLQKCIASAGGARRCVIIADQQVADLHLNRLRSALTDEPLVLTFAPGEAAKSLANLERLCEQLADGRIERGDIIVAFGGGVAGDLAGFVAAVWLRGIRFIQVPTTLLAAVDASVGGKTAVNLRTGKNLVGAFHQPIAVVADTDFLATLTDRDLTAGLAETVKQACISDADFLAWHEQNRTALNEREPEALAALIERNCALKADIVSQDEREAGLRANLNYGHTVGHAIEHLLEYELRHGECVALGMRVENEISVARGWLGRAAADRVASLLADLGVPARLPRPVDADTIWATTRVDKKSRGGAVNFVLLRDIGAPVQVGDVREDEVTAALGVIAAE